MATKLSQASSRDSKANEIILKERVKELEEEVTSLKRRLDELRKAKNTTILKREREVLEIGTPFGRRDSRNEDNKNTELEKKLHEAERNREKEMDELRKRFAAEMDQVRKDSKDCNHEEELLFLRHRNETLENDNVALIANNRDLMARVDGLVSELSIKEAKWCEIEEEFKLKLKTSWGEKYKEWMEATEAKIAELQKTNQILRAYLKKQHPGGKDPSGQEPDFDNL